jgi:hypothetical protein
MLSKDYCFYEQSKKLEENHKLKKGIHYIQYRWSLKGGLNTTIIMINDTQIPINIPNNTLTEYILKIIGAWLNTDGNLIDIYGMHDRFSRRYLLNKDDIIWNGRNDFKYLKGKITRNQDLNVSLDEALSELNIEWKDWEDFKLQGINWDWKCDEKDKGRKHFIFVDNMSKHKYKGRIENIHKSLITHVRVKYDFENYSRFNTRNLITCLETGVSISIY